MVSYKIIWNNNEVGQLINPMPDMWYLEGDWKSYGTNESVRFEKLLKSLDAKQVMTDLTKGPEIILRGEGMNDLNAVGISLHEDKLFVRRLVDKSNEPNDKSRKSLMDRLLRFFKAE